MVIENVSESNIQRHLTMGSLSAFLADGTTITSTGGKLTGVGPAADQLVPTGGVPGNVLTRVGATDAEFAAPVGDGVVESGEVTGTTLTLRRSQSLADVTITGLPQAGESTSDGVVTSIAATADHAITLERSQGLIDLTSTLPYEVILPDETTGNLPVFTAADINRIANDHGNICTVRGQVLNPATLLSVTTEAYAATGYRGVRYEPTDVGQPQADDTMFSYHNRRWYQWVAVLQVWAVTVGPSGWIGAFDTLASAEQAVTSVGQTFYSDAQRPRQVRRVTAYTAPAPADINYICLPEPAILALQNRVEEGVYAVPPDDVTQVGNLITLANLPPLSDGLLLYFTAEGANTAPVTIGIGSSTYTVLKAAPSGGAELFTGGEIENGLPLQLVWDSSEGTFYWFGTVLGSAARRDVGTDQSDLVALNFNGRIPSTLLGPGPTVGDVLKIGTDGPDWLPEESGQTQAETDARYLLKSGDTMEGSLVVEHTTGTAILSRVPTAGTRRPIQGQRMGRDLLLLLLGRGCGRNE